MAEELNDEQALAMLKQFVVQWRSLGYVEQIIKRAQAAKEFLDDLDKQKAAKQKEIDSLDEVKLAAANAVKSATVLAKAAQTETETTKGALSKEISELKKAKDQAADDLADIKNKLEAERARHDAMIAEKTGQLNKVRAQLSQLKEQL